MIVLLAKSSRHDNLASQLVYGTFDMICTRGLQVETGNPEIVLQSIMDHTMKRLVNYKKGIDPAVTDSSATHIMDDVVEIESHHDRK